MIDNKEIILEQIKEDYFYIHNKNKLNELINNLNNGIYEAQINMASSMEQMKNLDRLQTSLKPLHVNVNIKEPKVKLGWLPFLYLIGIFCLYSLAILFPFAFLYGKTDLANQPGSDSGQAVSNLVVGVVAIVAIFKTYRKVKKWKKEEYNKLYEEYNGENIRKANEANRLFEEIFQNVQVEREYIKYDIEDYKQTINKINENFLPEIKKKIEIIEKNKPELITVPIARRKDSNFYLLLYDVINSDQAMSLGEGVKIVEDRTESNEHTTAILNQIVASQHALQDTLIKGENKIIDNLNQNFEEIYEKVDSVNEKLDSIQTSVSSASSDILYKQDELIEQLKINNFKSKEIEDTLFDIKMTGKQLCSETAYGNRIITHNL
ncbi:hypothetical protein [Lactobacillus johnsonii]|uniref:hypothetical protein n=1 Tax=Lactobacillus johnsonii TaxID=33959 RepID=UPI001434A8A7|nr:hypothetical protein [Lactobacillus johnsonii]GFI19829.1 hypothetical protein IMSAGC010_00381 [Lactobacillus johnsonii]